jgi:hypothetical protein
MDNCDNIKAFLTQDNIIFSTIMTKSVQFHARISASDQVLLDQTKVGHTAAAAIGLNTIRLCTQRDTRFTCTYISKTGEAAPRPAAPSEALEGPAAQPCPCPACPIAQHFQTMPHKDRTHNKIERKGPGLLAYADHSTVEPGGGFKLVILDRIE